MLSGEIDSAEDRAEAVKIAANTEGVTRVEDHLRMKGETAATAGAADSARDAAHRVGAATSDAWITAKIQARYFPDPDVKWRNTNVDTNNGVVTLNDVVSLPAAREQAVHLARETDGVVTWSTPAAWIPR